MGIVTTVLFPGLVVALAGGLIAFHLRAWRASRFQALGRVERDFHRRQFRRRMQASSMMALLGVALFSGQLIPRERWQWFYVSFWCGVFLVVLWVVGLALADAVATANHVARLKRQRLAEHAQLQAALRRVQGGRRNGHPLDPPDK